MLHKIQIIEDECADKEEEVEELKKRIVRMLKDEKSEKERAGEAHLEDVSNIFDANQGVSDNLKELLFTFTEIK